MKKALILIFFLTAAILTAQNMLPNEILQKVFLIKVGANTGSCFFVSVDSADYLVTAKHLFPDTSHHNSTVEIPPRQVFCTFPLRPSAAPQQCLRPAANYDAILLIFATKTT